MRALFICLLIASMHSGNPMAQSVGTVPPGISSVDPTVLLGPFYEKTTRVKHQLRRQGQQYLRRLQVKERRLYRKVCKKDSTLARKLFADIEGRYRQYSQDLATDSLTIHPLRQQYIPILDSVGVAFRFLQDHHLLQPNATMPAKIQAGISALQQQMNQTSALQALLAERSELLETQLQSFGLLKELRKFRQELTYFKVTVTEYRSYLNQPDKLVSKLFNRLSAQPLFKQFFQRYSALAALLPPSPDANLLLNPAGGLQVRSLVMGSLQQSAGAGPNVNQLFQQQVSSAYTQLQAIKDKLAAFTKDKTVEDLEEYVPNQQKTKSILQRLELGTNFQSTRSTTFFPATTDIGLSVGYRLNDKSIVGVGGSYKAGWGKDIRHIAISHQGFGLRSFISHKIKGSFHATGGLEYNYQKPFRNFRELPGMKDWQKSGLVGISKVVALRHRLFKKTQLQLLYDLMSPNNTTAQPFIFRFGYNLK